jgi:hypothetical protein
LEGEEVVSAVESFIAGTIGLLAILSLIEILFLAQRTGFWRKR